MERLLLVKFFKEKHYADSFIDMGTVRLTRTDFYREYQEQEKKARTDVNEALKYIYKGRCKVDGIETSKETLVKFYEDKYIFSLSGFNLVIGEEIKISNNFRYFGSYAVIVLDIDEFLRRFKKAFAENFCLNDKWKFIQVKYTSFSNTPTQPLHLNQTSVSPMKDTDYEWQKEWRFSCDIPRKNEIHLNLHLGNLNDISRIIETGSLLNSIALKQNNI